MAFPRNAALTGQDAAPHRPPIEKADDDRDKNPWNAAAEDSKDEQITEVTENENAGASVITGSAEDPDANSANDRNDE